MHRSVAYLHLGANLQPLGRSRGCGTAPGIASSLWLAGVSSLGMEIKRPSVYGCEFSDFGLNRVRAGTLSTT